MTTQPTSVKAPELIAATPYLLGFIPHDAVVLYGLSDRGMMVGSAHMDQRVLSAATMSESIGKAVDALASHDAADVLITAFEDHPEATAAARDEIGWAATLAGLKVGQIWVASHGTCQRIDGSGTDEPVTTPAPEQSAFVTSLIADGASPVEDRGLAAARWVPTGSVRPAATTTPSDVDHAWTQLLDGETLTDDELAAAAAGVQHNIIRDALLGAVAGGRFAPNLNGVAPQVAQLSPAAMADRSNQRSECLDRLRRAIVRLEPRAAVPLLAMAAVIAWSDGEELTAGLVCEVTTAIDASNTLARMVATAIEHGVRA